MTADSLKWYIDECSMTCDLVTVTEYLCDK